MAQVIIIVIIIIIIIIIIIPPHRGVEVHDHVVRDLVQGFQGFS
jgi:hypothetical protein